MEFDIDGMLNPAKKSNLQNIIISGVESTLGSVARMSAIRSMNKKALSQSKMRVPLLELCVTNLEAAQAAENGGAGECYYGHDESGGIAEAIGYGSGTKGGGADKQIIEGTQHADGGTARPGVHSLEDGR